MNAWLTHTHKAALFAFAVGYNYGFDPGPEYWT